MKDRLDFRTATRSQLECVWKAIARETGDDRFFTTKELDILPQLMAEKEQVLSFSSGLVDSNTWLIVLTDQRIMLLDKGMFFGLKQISIELSKINSFESKTGLLFGSIDIGSNARNFSITNVWKKTVNPFTMKLREAQKAREERRRLNAPGSDEALALASSSPSALPTANNITPMPRLSAPVSAATLPAAVIMPRGDDKWLERLKNAGAINNAQYEAYKKS